MKDIYNSQKGAAALISSIVVSTVILSIVLSLTVVSIDNKTSINSFANSLQGFYAAESGAREALFQLKNEPNNLVFDDIVIGDIIVSREFVDDSELCNISLDCQYVPNSGWWGEYFNYSSSHPDIEIDPVPGPTPTPTQHDWYNDIYKTHEQVDSNLEFSMSDWYPYDGTIYEDKEGYDHDYFFGAHWRAIVDAPSSGDYSYSLASNDDSWILLDGIVVVNNSGVHTSTIQTGNISLIAGENIMDIYFADRHTTSTGSGFNFSFDNNSLDFTPWPEGCGEIILCNSNIQATASTSDSTRKARYTCSDQIENCAWNELIP